MWVGVCPSQPIIASPEQNAALLVLLRKTKYASAWIGLADDAEKPPVPLTHAGGGWNWVDGVDAGRPLRSASVFFPGFHHWRGGEPPSGDRGQCAWMDAGTGELRGAACDSTRAVVCCRAPVPATKSSVGEFSCTRGIVEGSEEWPLVPFFYRDHPLRDDLPNTEYATCPFIVQWGKTRLCVLGRRYAGIA